MPKKHYGIFIKGPIFGLAFGKHLMNTSDDKKYLEYLKNEKWEKYKNILTIEQI